MSDQQETKQEEKKPGFFARTGAKIMEKVRAINPNIIGKAVLAVLAFVIVITVIMMVYNVFSTIAGDSENKLGNIIGNIVLSVVFIVVVIGIGFMTWHMMTTLIKEGQFKTDYSVEKFKEMRKAAGKSEDSSESENQQCRELLDKTYESWTVVDGDTRLPKTMKEVVNAKNLLVQIIDIAPTNPEIVNEFVNYAEVVKEKTERQFDGSGMLLGLAAIMVIGMIVMGLLSLAGGVQGIFAFLYILIAALIIWGAPSALYFMACRTPFYMLEERKDRKPSRFKFVNLIIGIIFGVGMAGIMARGSGTEWYSVYSDGRKEYDVGMNMSWLFLKICLKAFIAMCVLFLLFMISLTIIIWAFINYLRNYVIYK